MRRVLFILLAVVLVRGAIYALLDPHLGAPDEKDHLQYIASLATAGAAGDRGREGHQPVLYYAMMVPAYLLSAGHSDYVQLMAIRLFGLPLLMGQVLFAWLAARRLAPRRPLVAVVAAAIVALQPELAYVGASANNDDLANFVAALLTYLAVSMLTGSGWWMVPATGLAVAAALLSKGQVLPMAGLVGLLALWRLMRPPPRQAPTRKRLHGVPPDEGESGGRKPETEDRGPGAGYASPLSPESSLLGSSPGRWAAALLVTGGLVAAAAAAQESRVMVTRSEWVLNTLARLPQAMEAAGRFGSEVWSYQLISFWGAFLTERIRPAPEWYLLPAAVVAVGLWGYLIRGARLPEGLGPSAVARALAPRAVLLLIFPLQWVPVYLIFLQHALLPTFPWTPQYMHGRYLLPFLVPLALLVGDGWSLLAPDRKWDGRLAVAAVGMLALFDAAAIGALVGYYSFPPDLLP